VKVTLPVGESPVTFALQMVNLPTFIDDGEQDIATDVEACAFATDSLIVFAPLVTETYLLPLSRSRSFGLIPTGAVTAMDVEESFWLPLLVEVRLVVYPSRIDALRNNTSPRTSGGTRGLRTIYKRLRPVNRSMKHRSEKDCAFWLGNTRDSFHGNGCRFP